MEKEEKKTKIYDFIKGNILNALVFITSFAYIFYNMISINKTDLTLTEQLASAGIGLVIGIIIKQSLGENGFNKGYRSNIWLTNLEKYSKACNLANGYIERVDNFYTCEEIEKKRKYRRQNLMAVRLKYEWFFDNKGNYINPPTISLKRAKNKQKEDLKGLIVLTPHQAKVLHKCVKVKIYNLNLFSEYSAEIEQDTKKEKTDKEQRTMMFSKNSLMALLTAVVGAYFLPMWKGWDWGKFIIATVQVCIWVASGITQLYKNYNYIVIEKVSKLTRKMEMIIKFTRGCEKGLYVKDPYEEMEEVEQNGQTTKDEVLDTNDPICNV